MSTEPNAAVDDTPQEGPQEVADSYGWTSGRLQGARLREAWGGSGDDFEAGLELAGLAAERLGLSEEESAARLGKTPTRQARTLDDARSLGLGFRHLPEGLTPAEARVMRDELKADKDFTDRMMRGEAVARSQWRALNHLAARAKG